MALEVLAWNVHDAFDGRSGVAAAVDALEENETDVAIFSEAYSEGLDEPWLVAEAQGVFKKLGYVVSRAAYADDDGRKDRHGILAVAKREILQSSQIIRLWGRNAVRMALTDPQSETRVDFFGVHLDDRREERRRNQAAALAGMALEAPGTVVIAGDLNALHGKDMKSRLLRAAQPMMGLMPSSDPREQLKPSKLSRIGSLGQRLCEMADGGTVRLFEEAGFEDADARHKPTKGFWQLDHILVESGRVGIEDFRIHKRRDPLIDHRAISARLVF